MEAQRTKALGLSLQQHGRAAVASTPVRSEAPILPSAKIRHMGEDSGRAHWDTDD